MRALGLAGMSGLLAVVLGGCGEDTCDLDTPGTICTVAGRPTVGGYAGDGGGARDALLYRPFAIATSPAGELWISDANFVVRAIDLEGRITTRIGTGGLEGEPLAPGESVAARDVTGKVIYDMVFAGDALYAANAIMSQVWRVDLPTMTVSNVAGRGVRALYDGDGGPAVAAALDVPSALALDPAGRLVLIDASNQVIRRIEPDGTIVRIAGQCVATAFGCSPEQPVVACPGSNRFSCDGNCSAGCELAYAGDGGSAFDMRMAQRRGSFDGIGTKLLYDPAGNLIFTDPNNDRIRRIDATGIVTTIAGTGEAGYAGDGELATSALLYGPAGLALASDGTLYVADAINHCVRAIAPAGTITTAAGRCGNWRDQARYCAAPGECFGGDGGPATDALLASPTSLAIAGDRLYIADTGNHVIRAVRLP